MKLITHSLLVVLAATMAACQGGKTLPGSCTLGEAREGATIETFECQNFERVQSQQQNDEWCWAACVQIIRKYNENVELSQEKIAARYRQTSDNQTARYDEMIRALAEHPDRLTMLREGVTEDAANAALGDEDTRSNLALKKQFELNATAWAKAAIDANVIDMTIFDDLARGEPIIVGLKKTEHTESGHLCVIYGMTREKDPEKQGPEVPVIRQVSEMFESMGMRSGCRITMVQIFDPWENTGSYTMSGEELLANARFVLSQRKAREIWAKTYGTLFDQKSTR